MMQNRSKPEITAMMLESARMGATKTKMMYNAYLSHTQVQEYMKFLQKSDLLTYEKDTQLYRPTEKGLKFVNLLNALGEIVPLSNPENYNIES